MSWYSTGSVAVSNGSATIIGTGTKWVRNVREGDAFQGPDRIFYEVGEVVSDVEIALATSYAGSTANGVAYTITPTTSHDKELVDGITSLLSKADKESYAYASRADFVTAQAKEQYSIGAIAHAGGVSYRYDGISAAIADMPGWTWHGQATDRHFGVVGDGVTDDAAALAAFAAAFDAERAVRPAHWHILPGRYRMTAGIKFVDPANPGNYRSTLNWDGAEFVCDYERTGKDYLIAFGDPDAAGTYQAILDIEGRVYFSRGTNCTYPPVAVYYGSMAQSSLNGINAGSWGNTIVDMPGIQNVACEDWTIYSGGYSFGYKNMSDSRYRQSGNTLSRVSGTRSFSTSDVGKVIEIKGGTLNRKSTITAYNSPTSVNVDLAFDDTIDREVQFGSPAPKTTAGSAVVGLDGDVTADMVGLWVGIPRAGANGKILWGHIISVDAGANTITLDRTASTTLNPVVNPTTQTTEIACPAVAIRSDLSSEGGAFANGISQVRFLNLQIETHRGVAVGVDDAEFVHFTQCKLHGNSQATWNTYALASIWANRLGGTYLGELDQRTMGRYKLVFADQTFPFHFISLQVRSKLGEKLMRVQPYKAGSAGAVITFDQLAVLGLGGETFASLVDDTNTTLAPGHLPPTRFIRPDRDEAEYGIGRKASVDKDGKLTVTGIRNSAGMQPWTPVLADAPSGGNVAGGTFLGAYQRVGNLVFISGRLTDIDTTGMTAGGDLHIRGLPFPLLSGYDGIATGTARFEKVTFTGEPIIWADNGDDYLLLYEQVSGGYARTVTVSQIISGSGIIRFSLVYPTGAE